MVNEKKEHCFFRMFPLLDALPQACLLSNHCPKTRCSKIPVFLPGETFSISSIFGYRIFENK